MLTKNVILTVGVTDINHMGLGVARSEGEGKGKVIFIRGGVTGDKLEIKIIKSAKDYCVAKIEQIIEPSPYRREPECPTFRRCGGCVYGHISPEYEAELKHLRVRGEFSRFKLGDIEVRPVIAAKLKGYRNKLQCPVTEDGRLGFYAEHSHQIVPIEVCSLQEKLLLPVFSYLNECLQKVPIKELRHIYLRCGAGSGEVMVCFVASKRSFTGDSALAERIISEFPEVKSVVLNYNPDDTNVVLGKECRTLAGREVIYDTLCGLKFEIHPLSFYQVNHDCTELLYKTAAEFADIGPDDTLLDLYCGIGTVGMCINNITPAKRLIGVEIIPEAVENARHNAEINGISNAEFHCAPAETAELPAADVVVVDPPRKGCAPSLIEYLGKAAPKRIVYISCSPDTLARDCAMLTRYGYEIGAVQPVNMFPGTGHVETVVLLSKKQRVY